MTRNLPVLQPQGVESAGLGMATRRNVKVADSVEETVERSDSVLKELVNELLKVLVKMCIVVMGKL